MAIKCIQPDGSRYEFGYPSGFVNRVKKYVGDLTRKKSRNLLRNLGIDDVRGLDIEYTTKNGNKKRFFGINRAEIDEYDAVKTQGKKLQSGVLVKVPRSDGADDFFISNKSTELAPSRWIMDGEDLRPNPDWDRVGENITLDESGGPRLFVEDNGVYRLPQEGEQGEVFLNIQNPIKQQGKLPKREIAERGIDAYEIGPNTYRPVHPESQVIEPSKAANRQNFDAINKRSELLDSLLSEEVTQAMEEGLGVGGRTALTLGGAVTGEMIDSEDGSGFWWGGALGFMLGTPRVVNKVKGFYKSGEGGADQYDQMKNTLRENEKHYDKVREDKQMFGYEGDPSDRTRFQKFRDAVSNPIREAVRNGKEWKDIILRNRYFESAQSFFNRLPTPTGKELVKKIAGLETAPNIIFSKYGKHADRVFGDQGIRKVNQVQQDFINNFYGREVDEATARQEFGAALHRIITYEGEIVDGAYKFNQSNKAAQAIYQSDELQQFDRALLQSEQGQQVLDVVRSTFEEVRQMVTEAKVNRINDIAGEIRSEYQPLFRRLRESNLGSEQFETYLSKNHPNDYRTFKKATTQGKQDGNGLSTYDKQFDRALQWHDDIVRLDNLQGKYVPQIFSPDKAKVAKERFIRNNDLENVRQSKQDTEWRRHLAINVQRLNKDGDKFLGEAADGMDYSVKIYGSHSGALNHLQDTIAPNILDDTTRSIVLNAIDNGNGRQFVGSFIDGDGKEKFYLKNPDSYKEQDLNIFQNVNEETMNKIQSTYLSTITYKQSNFLDRPRKFNLPTTLIETDVETMMRKYAADVGPRTHMIREGIDDLDKVESYLGKIWNELKGTIDDKKTVVDNFNQIKEWYNNMTGLHSSFEVGKSTEERIRQFQNRNRSQKIVSTLRNFAGAPFLYFTTAYSAFTPFVMGPFLASWGSIGKTYKQYMQNPQALRKMTNEMEKRGVIDRSMTSYRPELGDQWGKDLTPNSDASWLDRLHHTSKKAANFSASLSLSKPILSKLGVDYENTGLLRLISGDMFDISGAESGLMTMAVLREIEEWVEVGNKIKKGTYEGSQRMGDVRRNLQRFGIDDVDGFLKDKDKINQFVKAMEGSKEIKIDDLPDTFNEQMTRVMDTIVNQYHGRTKLSRPLKWTNNPYGRLLSQFSVYVQNFAVQTVGDRVYRPIKNWNERYATSKEVPAMKIAYWAGTGNEKKLKELFGDQWKQAYDDFPVQAYSNFFKVFGALGAGQAMMMSRSAMMDVTEIAANEAMGIDDYDAWQNVKKDWVINPQEPESEQITFGDIFSDDVAGFQKFSIFRHMLYLGTRLGFGGRQAQLAINESRYTQGGLASKFPMGSLAQSVYEDLGEIIHSPVEDMPETAARNILNNALLYTPALGTFHGVRKTGENIVFEKPKNRDIVNSWVDSETGLPLQNQQMNGGW